jgi:murein DD-endopeptidase MepM/ murein hydrolase activator NlpD
MNDLVWQLVVFVVWSQLLWWLVQGVQRRWPLLLQKPFLYWLLCACCFAPLLPQINWQQTGMIPPQLLLEMVGHTTHWAATAQHPSLLQSLHLRDVILPLLLLLWLSGVCWRLYRLGQQWRRLTLLADAVPQPQISALLADISPEHAALLLPSLKKLRLKQQSAISSPFVFGCWHLTLVLPQNFAAFPPTERLLLLQHELCHVRRRDPQQLLLWRLLVQLFWFNPVLARLEAAFGRAIEFTVDRQVLAQQPAAALSYGKAMLSCLKYQQAAGELSAGFAQPDCDESFYRQRLLQLFQPAPQHEFRQLAGVLLAIFMLSALVYLLFGALQTQNNAPDRWLWPLERVQINSGYGVKSAIRQYRPHLGLDLDGNRGDAISAAAAGRVLIADNSSLHANFGNVVLLDHGGGYQTLYAHLDKIQLRAGDYIAAGTQLGTVGSSGKTTGPHLHFELLHFGQAQNPLALLPAL